jgi:hypothetical protein
MPGLRLRQKAGQKYQSEDKKIIFGIFPQK